MLDQRWAYLVYAGLWWDPLRSDLDAYMDAANAQVTGTIGIKLYKGSARAVTRSSPHAVYDAQLATFAESGGLFAQAASPGFIELWSLQSRMAWRLRHGQQDRAANPGVASPQWVTRFLDSWSGRAASGICASACPARSSRLQGSPARRSPAALVVQRRVAH